MVFLWEGPWSRGALHIHECVAGLCCFCRDRRQQPWTGRPRQTRAWMTAFPQSTCCGCFRFLLIHSVFPSPGSRRAQGCVLCSAAHQ